MDAEVIQYILGIFVILVFQKGTKGAGDSFDFTVFVYYSNELRPYMLQIAASCAVSMLFWQVSRGEPVKFHVFFGSLFFYVLQA